MSIRQQIQDHRTLGWILFFLLLFIFGTGTAMILTALGQGGTWPQRIASVGGSTVAGLLWHKVIGRFPWDAKSPAI